MASINASTWLRRRLKRGNGVKRPDGPDWLEGHGIAISMHGSVPPTEHRSEARLGLGADGNYHLAIGTAEFGNGTTTVHGQIVASVLGSTVSRVRIVQSDTDKTGYDTGAFASAGHGGRRQRRAARGRGAARPDTELRFEKLRGRPRRLPDRPRRDHLQRHPRSAG